MFIPSRFCRRSLRLHNSSCLRPPVVRLALTRPRTIGTVATFPGSRSNVNYNFNSELSHQSRPHYYRPQPKLLSRNLQYRRYCTSEGRDIVRSSTVESSSGTMTPTLRSNDPNTLSNTDDWRTVATEVDFTISFEKKRVSGVVRLNLERVEGKKEKDCGEGAGDGGIWLDSSYLEVLGVRANGEEAEWAVEGRAEPYGGRVVVKLGGKGKGKKGVLLEIECATTEKCTALQWMEKEQTGNGKWPYMFSQCQAIHARSLFPCQDTPSVKSTYKSTIRSPLPVVVSGLFAGTTDYLPPSDGEEHGTLAYHFSQNIPIPSYLYALASGDLASASIGPRSMVWSGPEELLRNKQELEGEVEKFIEVAEKLIFPYEWTTYNVLILPPSFPYGGMENPNMTFATPTIISGDKSNIDVIAHELAHSWSGNLVSNSSWEHFWLNEGWTTYIERRIQGALHGEPHFHFSAIIGWKALKESVSLYGDDHPFTRLVVDLNGKDPDDAFSSIPYEKGFNFLYFLDRTIGREKWDKFIPHYFKTYTKTSLTSENFKSTLLSFFKDDKEASAALEREVDWQKSYFAPGLPPKPDFDTSLVDQCYKLADQWVALNKNQGESSSKFTPSPNDISNFSSLQLVAFLERLLDLPPPDQLSPKLTTLMDETYSFTKSENAEILARYYQLALGSQDTNVYTMAAAWLGTVGRMKFVRPIYRALEKVDRELAVKTFERFRGWYHPICRDIVAKDLGV